MDLYDQDTKQRFHRAREGADAQLDPFKWQRRRVIKLYAGSEYGDGVEDEKRKKTVLPLMQDFIGSATMMLSGGRPAVEVAPKHGQSGLEPFARIMKAMTNFTLKEIDAETTFFRITMDAICGGMGIGKVCFAPGNEVQIRNPQLPPEPSMYDGPRAWDQYRQMQQVMPSHINVDAGKPMFFRPSFDDMSFDIPAESWEMMEWVSEDYRLPFETVRNDERYSEELRKLLTPDSKFEKNSKPRASTISDKRSELRDKITLTDVYLPPMRCWYTIVKKDPSLPPLYMEKWRGPDWGPYIPLTFHDVPDNIMPISKAAALAPLHEFINLMWRKAMSQAANQKNILMYQSDKDAKAIAAAEDMQAVKVINPKGIEVASFNGENRVTLATANLGEQEFSKRAGNLDAQLGLGAQASTAKQEELIKSSTNMQIDLLKSRNLKFATKVIESLTWMIFVDRAKRQQLAVQFAGQQTPLTVEWTPEDRDGDWFSYNFTVDPYSLPYKAPTDRLEEVDRFMQKLAPFMMQMQQMGIVPNWPSIFEMNADLTDNPYLRKVFLVGNSPIEYPDAPSGAPPGGGGPEMELPQDAGQPGSGGRYIRQTQSSPQEQSARTSQALLSGGGPAIAMQ